MDLKREKLLKNVGRLADALGVSPVFIKRMKWAGFPMPGGVSTVAWALQWLRQHPEFRQKDFVRKPEIKGRQDGPTAGI